MLECIDSSYGGRFIASVGTLVLTRWECQTVSESERTLVRRTDFNIAAGAQAQNHSRAMRGETISGTSRILGENQFACFALLIGDLLGRIQNCFDNPHLPFPWHADDGRGDADRSYHIAALRTDSGSHANTSKGRFFAVKRIAGLAHRLKLLKKRTPVHNCLRSSGREAINFQNPIDGGKFLVRRDHFAHRAAMRRKHAPRAIRDANLMESLEGFKHLNPIVEQVSHASRLVEAASQSLHFWASKISKRFSAF